MQAIRNNWAVPDDKKPEVIDELIAIVKDPEVKPISKVMACNVLTKADQIQYERDHPELYGKAGAVNVNVNNQANMAITAAEISELLSKAEAQRKGMLMQNRINELPDGS
jgi:hypothetical protein